MPFHSTTALSWRFNVVGNTTTYVGTYVKAPIFQPDCHQIWNFSTDFHKVPISNFPYIRRVTAAGTRTDTHYGSNLSSFVVNMRTRLTEGK
jgi:hypothetical protein